MTTVAGRILSLDTDPFPGWARIELELAGDGRAEVFDKKPVLGISGDRPDALVFLDCDVVEQTSEGVTIRLRHGVETTDGRSVLQVRSSQVTM